ncbi:MAG TPA: hypothetical protein VK661_11200 [Planctomycetota bacterium]|nr:hypothetical protein [Planctomycetota bacterium]
MRIAAVFSLLALGLPAFQEDPYEELKKLDAERTVIQGPLYVLRTLKNEMFLATKALDDSQLDIADRHLLRFAEVSRPYNEEDARRAVGIALELRAEARAEGATLTLAVAEDLKQGRAAAAQARIDEALNPKTSFLAKTYRADIERLREWLKKAPDPAAVESEVKRWRALMPPGFASACAACNRTGETNCALCQSGLVPQSCRTCSGKGQGPCSLCKGEGTLPHGGFAGELRIRIDKDFKFKLPGDKRIYTMKAQRLFWTLRPCAGAGSVDLRTVTNPLDPNAGAGSPERHNLKCGELFNQLRANVFTGKARVFTSQYEDARDELKPELMKRLFADYEKCKDGRLPCEACEGRRSGTCSNCAGKGTRLGSCSDCGGAGSTSCAACKTSGDSSWLATKVPATKMPALGGCLDVHVKALAAWQDRRAKEKGKREQVRGQIGQARQGLDPTAKLTAQFVNIACAKCQGKGGACEDCWGVGRREYYPGTPVYERYATAIKLEEQYAKLSQASMGVTSAEIQLKIEDNLLDHDFRLPPAPKDGPVQPPPARPPGAGSGIGGEISGLPEDLRTKLAEADKLHEEGKAALTKAKASDDNAVWQTEAKKAVKCFWDAQMKYSEVQETLDERGIDVPRALVDKISTNQQALVMARKTVP